MLADVLEILRNMCLEIQELDPTHFLSASVLVLVKLDLLTDIDKLLMMEKCVMMYHDKLLMIAKMYEVKYVMLFIDL